jgi:protein gp37
MAENSKIEWTTHTFNPWRGCTKVSPGCAHCYAETLSHRNPGTLGVWGPNGTRVVASEATWREPVRWNAAAAKAGERHRVFCASLADLFEGWPGQMTDSAGSPLWTGPLFEPGGKEHAHWWRAGERGDSRPLDQCHVLFRLLDLIRRTPSLDWLLLTKRPQHIGLGLAAASRCVYGGDVDDTLIWLSNWPCGEPPANVWLGTSVENQAAADERIPALLETPARVRFLSCEPLLGPVDLSPWVFCDRCRGPHPCGPGAYETPLDNAAGGCWFRECRCSPLGWVIVGGESGGEARPMNPDWARSLRDQCKSAGVAFFYKQWGEYAPSDAGGFFSPTDRKSHTVDEIGRLDVPTGGGKLTLLRRVGKKQAGRLLDGVEHSEFPA